MVDKKDIKLQINEYHKLLEELRAEKIELPEKFIAGLLIEKLHDSLSDYKQQLKHKQKQLSLVDLISNAPIPRECTVHETVRAYTNTKCHIVVSWR